MKKILISLMAIILVIGLVGAGVTAQFSDTETSTGNTFQAGTLNLEVGEGSEDPISLTCMAPGVESDEYTLIWENVGCLPGNLNWEITSVTGSDGTGGNPANDVDVNAEDFADCIVVSDAYFDRDIDTFIEPLGDNGASDYTTSLASPLNVIDDVTEWYGLTDAERISVITNSTWGDIDDEWVLLDWIRWGDTNGDGKLTIDEIDDMAPGSWNVGDTNNTSAMDANEVYTHKLKFMLDDSLYTGTGTHVNDLQADGIEVDITVNLIQVT